MSHQRRNNHKSGHSHHHGHHKNQLKLIEVNEGEKIVLTCSTVTSTKPVTQLIWFKNDQQLIPSVNSNLINLTTTAIPPTFTSGSLLSPSTISFKVTDGDDDRQLFKSESTLIQFVTLADQNSIFKCEALHPGLMSSSGHRSVTDAIKLSILYPAGSPVIEGYRQKDGQLKSGDQITLACLSRGGNPLPKLSWIKNDLIVDETFSVTDDLNEEVINEGSISEGGSKLTTNTYSFTVGASDNGAKFKCVSSNSISSSSSEVKLDVTFPPVNIQITGPNIGKVNDILNYNCLIGPSNPVPEAVLLDGERCPSCVLEE